MMHLHGEASSNAGSQLSKNSGLRRKFKSEITPIEMVKELQQNETEKQAEDKGEKGDKVPTMLELVEEEYQENPTPNPQKTPTMQELIT